MKKRKKMFKMLKIQVEIKSLTKTLLIRQSWQNLHTSISHKFTRSIYPMKNYLEFRNKLVLLRWNVHSLTSLERYIFISSLPSLHGNQGTQTLAGRRNWGNDSSDAITSPFSPLSSFSRVPSIDISIGFDEARMNIQGLGMRAASKEGASSFRCSMQT